MSRLFAEPLPAHMEWNEGEPGALRVGHRRLVVVEVVRRWRVDGEWWADGIAREVYWQMLGERSEADTLQCLAWLYDGFELPAGPEPSQ